MFTFDIAVALAATHRLLSVLAVAEAKREHACRQRRRERARVQAEAAHVQAESEQSRARAVIPLLPTVKKVKFFKTSDLFAPLTSLN